MGAGFFTTRFDSSEDYRRALLEGPWKIGEHYIVPRLWQEGSILARIISPILLFGFGSMGFPLSSSRRHSCGVSVI
ncbi:hypothetical protein LINPERHAP2_LOCUS20628 [Linum perenne]